MDSLFVFRSRSTLLSYLFMRPETTDLKGVPSTKQPFVLIIKNPAFFFCMCYYYGFLFEMEIVCYNTHYLLRARLPFQKEEGGHISVLEATILRKLPQQMVSQTIQKPFFQNHLKAYIDLCA